MDNYLEQFDLDTQETPINWREIFEKVVANWKWFAISASIAIAAGYLYGRMQPNVYELKTSILITDPTRSGQMNELSVLKQLDAVGMGSRSTSMVNNEEQVLKSTTLMKRIVNQLELHTTYTRKSMLQSEELYKNSDLYVHMDSTSLSKLKSSLELNISPSNKQLIIEGKFKDQVFTREIKQLPAYIQTPAGNIFIQLRHGHDFPTEDLIVRIDDPVQSARYYAKTAISTEVTKLCDAINLSINTSNIEKGQDILNTLTSIYNQDATEQNNLSANNTARFIKTRMGLLSEELSDVEHKVENYKQANGLTDIDEDAKIFLNKTGDFDQQQIQVEMQQNLVKYVEDYVKNPANKYALIPYLGISDLPLAAAIQKNNELVMTLDRIESSSSDENPTLKSLKQQINSNRNGILNGISNSRKGLQITKKDLNSENDAMQAKIREIPRKEREFIEIEREQKVKATLYLFLLQKREEASLNMAVTVPKGRVLDTPDFAVIVGPNRKLILLIFFLLGLIIPGLIIYIKSLINNTVKSREDVEKKTKIPVITELGRNLENAMLIDNTPNSSSNAELFRLLRTKLQFMLEQPREKVILVTSTMTGEGKTFVSLNLAAMLALADKKVILLGMDLRNPQINQHLGSTQKDGISAYLSGQINHYESLIYKSTIAQNLDVLPAGVIPPNPTELIMKNRLNELISDLRDKYDYIVIDTAPVGAVSDTFLIDRISDITLYVCRAGYTDKRNIDFVNRIDQEKTLKRIQFVINDVDLESSRYSYHSKYGYGYGKNDK